MKTEFLSIQPVLPTANMHRDVHWYSEKLGFTPVSGDEMYAVLTRGTFCIHLQWHADTENDPLLGGSVIKLFVKNIQPLFEELVERGAVDADKLQRNTPWGTHEFGLYDLNKNALFFVEDAD